ncbi:hypothetical protein PENANT_c007G02690 [Penicillium antarcticum]|uniref:Uncharacterized protein n=1 Tax=Penicillium antarcticum TaxID=416450 RepID=A0A1V6QBK9_9EURO|nr:hypothetical protein PENANT_c007G02690 [Penicillium antarcticum]
MPMANAAPNLSVVCEKFLVADLVFLQAVQQPFKPITDTFLFKSKPKLNQCKFDGTYVEPDKVDSAMSSDFDLESTSSETPVNRNGDTDPNRISRKSYTILATHTNWNDFGIADMNLYSK